MHSLEEKLEASELGCHQLEKDLRRLLDGANEDSFAHYRTGEEHLAMKEQRIKEHETHNRRIQNDVSSLQDELRTNRKLNKELRDIVLRQKIAMDAMREEINVCHDERIPSSKKYFGHITSDKEAARPVSVRSEPVSKRREDDDIAESQLTIHKLTRHVQSLEDQNREVHRQLNAVQRELTGEIRQMDQDLKQWKFKAEASATEASSDRVKSLLAKVEELEKRMQTDRKEHEREVLSMTQHFNHEVRHSQQLESEVKKWKDAVNEWKVPQQQDAKIAQLERELDQQKRDDRQIINDLQMKLKQELDRSNKLLQTNEKYRASLSENDNSNTKAIKTVDSIQSDLRDLLQKRTEEKSNLEKNNAEVRQAFEQCKDENRALREQLEKTVEAAKTRRQSKPADVNDQQSVIPPIPVKPAESKAPVSLEVDKQQISKLTKEVEKLTKTLQIKDHELQSMSKELQALVPLADKKKHKHKKEYDEIVRNLTNQLSSAQHQNSQLQRLLTAQAESGVAPDSKVTASVKEGNGDHDDEQSVRTLKNALTHQRQSFTLHKEQLEKDLLEEKEENSKLKERLTTLRAEAESEIERKMKVINELADLSRQHGYALEAEKILNGHPPSIAWSIPLKEPEVTHKPAQAKRHSSSAKAKQSDSRSPVEAIVLPIAAEVKVISKEQPQSSVVPELTVTASAGGQAVLQVDDTQSNIETTSGDVSDAASEVSTEGGHKSKKPSSFTKLMLKMG